MRFRNFLNIWLELFCTPHLFIMLFLRRHTFPAHGRPSTTSSYFCSELHTSFRIPASEFYIFLFNIFFIIISIIDSPLNLKFKLSYTFIFQLEDIPFECHSDSDYNSKTQKKIVWNWSKLYSVVQSLMVFVHIFN